MVLFYKVAKHGDVLMCEGMEYCGACKEHAFSHGVEEWALGETHELPVFADAAQESAATWRRHNRFLALVASHDTSVGHWPEFNRLIARLGLEGIDDFGSYSMVQMCSIAMHRGGSVGDWVRRGERLKRRGVDPNTRPKYRRAMLKVKSLLGESEAKVVILAPRTISRKEVRLAA